jgi:predicted nucleic acid-binding protein
MSTKVDIGVSTRTLVPGCRTHPGAILVSSLESNGCWLSEFDITHLRKLAAAITETGVATWALEYRRVGNPGGGWPGTFQDIARGTDHLRVLAKTYPLDLDRVIAAGHSAGGHLALWLAARSKLRNHEPFRAENPILPGAVLALAPAPDLAYLHEQEVEEIAVAVLGDDDLGLSVQVLQEFSVQATRSSRLARMSRAEATVLIEAFLRFPVQEMTLPLLHASRESKERYGISHRDAAILEAARSLRCGTVLSEDLNEARDCDGVKVVNPFRRRENQ